MEALVNGKNLWLSEIAAGNYSFELRKDCFCSFDGQTIRVSVRDGIMTHAEIAPSNTGEEKGVSKFRPTMRELFELVLELSKREFASEGTLKVEYDQTLGYPASVSWNGDGFDDFFLVTVSNVVAE
ncbi:MAG: DUF6174 domain-containing protein [Gammaproteobacteria bacterium]|nr:DUF6174 domain-containing protein [Gammaproteobacteria bacterium]